MIEKAKEEDQSQEEHNDFKNAVNGHHYLSRTRSASGVYVIGAGIHLYICLFICICTCMQGSSQRGKEGGGSPQF